MRILITGGMGFIGHNVAVRLAKHGHAISVIDCYQPYHDNDRRYLVSEREKKIESVINPRVNGRPITLYQNYYYVLPIQTIEIERIFSAAPSFDIVIHLASYPNQRAVNEHPVTAADTMITGLINLCELSKKYKVNRFVYISSSMVYGNFLTSNITEDTTCSPIGKYGMLKYTGEQLVKEYANSGAFDYTIIRPSAVYGPLDNLDRVIMKFMNAAMKNECLTVDGSNEMLDFTYVDDVVDGIIGAALNNQTKQETYNITRGKSRSLLEVAELIIKLAGAGKIHLNERDHSYPKRGALNIDAARIDFGYNPKIDIEEGLALTYDWFKQYTLWKALQQ